MMHGKLIHHLMKSLEIPNCRNYKNFGHKRQPVAGITVLWHGFLTFTFIGLAVEWKRIAKFFLGDFGENTEMPFDPNDPAQNKYKVNGNP